MKNVRVRKKVDGLISSNAASATAGALRSALIDMLMNDVFEFTHQHGAWHEEFLLFDVWEARTRGFLADHWHAIRVLGADTCGLTN